jgi:hypothetical protein
MDFLHVERPRRIAKIDWGKADFVHVISSSWAAGAQSSK